MERLLHSGTAKKIAIALIALAGLGAISLAALVHYHPVMLTDIRISREIQEGQGLSLLLTMEAISIFGTPSVALAVVLIAAVAFFLIRRRREAIFTLSVLLTSGANALLKLLINRPRPSDTLITVYQKLTDASFPSGHVVFYVVFFGFLTTTMLIVTKIPRALKIFISTISLALILFVSVSRIYLGAHWATDVIGGYCVGFVFLSVLLYFYFKGLKFEG